MQTLPVASCSSPSALWRMTLRSTKSSWLIASMAPSLQKASKSPEISYTETDNVSLQAQLNIAKFTHAHLSSENHDASGGEVFWNDNLLILFSILSAFGDLRRSDLFKGRRDTTMSRGVILPFFNAGLDRGTEDI